METFCASEYPYVFCKNVIMRFTRHNNVKYTIIIACLQSVVYLSRIPCLAPTVQRNRGTTFLFPIITLTSHMEVVSW